MGRVTEPFPIFYDDDGTPLDDGMIYVGVVNQDARANPTPVFWDEALTEPITQPVRTLNGRPAYQGAPANIYIAGIEYSLSVLNRFGTPVLTVLDATDPGPSAGRFTAYTNVVGPFELIDLGTTVPESGVYIGAGGNSISFTNPLSTPSGRPDTDHQRATMLIQATTTDDGNSEEQTLAMTTIIQTGFSKTWATSTAFALNDNIRFADARNSTYRCIQAGTSAAVGTGPTGFGLAIVDGTCVWQWINDSIINAKLGMYSEVVALPGAGNCWAQVHNFEIESGVLTNFVCNTELDLTNECGTDSEAVADGLQKYGLWVACQGVSRSTAGMQITSANTANDALIWGLYFAGTRLATNAIIGIDASSANYGIGFGTGAGGVVTPTFGVAAYKDKSTTPKAMILDGINSNTSFEITALSPLAIGIGGTHSVASILDLSITPVGISLGGTYARTPIRYVTLPPNYANDAAAAAGGLLVGDTYRNGSVLQVRVV